MRLALVAGRDPSPLFAQWRDALSSMKIEHLNLESVVEVKIMDERPPLLQFGLDWTRDTVTGKRRDRFIVSSVRLAYFPGAPLARAWLAAAFAGYCLHEALELVSVDGVRPLDPHEEITHGHRLDPHPYDRGLRDGFPLVLTPESLIRSLCVVMDEDAALAFMERHGE